MSDKLTPADPADLAASRRRELIVEPEDCQRCAGHFHRSRVLADIGAVHANATSREQVMDPAIEDVELFGGRGAEPVDHHCHAVASSSATRAGAADALRAELSESRPELLDRIARSIPAGRGWRARPQITRMPA